MGLGFTSEHADPPGDERADLSQSLRSISPMKHIHALPLVLICVLFSACCPLSSGLDEEFYGVLSQPKEAHIDVSDGLLANLDDEDRSILFRYLAGNPRWEIRQKGDIKYAVRQEKVDGKYEATLNGFYSSGHGGDDYRQTRVLLAFEDGHGFGRERGNITRAKPGNGDVPVIVEAPHKGTPGHSSYVIIEGRQIYLEIYDQAVEVPRTFTQQTVNEVLAEVAEVLKHRDAIKTTGVMPVASYYPVEPLKGAHFTVEDGMQPGIYLLSAAVNPELPGHIYLKVYDTKSGERLSETRLLSRSMRYVGWSDAGQTFFPYNAEVTVYEGDWSTQYEARFELWHKPDQGQESKVAQVTRMINGWQR